MCTSTLVSSIEPDGKDTNIASDSVPLPPIHNAIQVALGSYDDNILCTELGRTNSESGTIQHLTLMFVEIMCLPIVATWRVCEYDQLSKNKEF